MSATYPGGLITKTPVTPVDGVASGIWTLAEQAYWQKQGAWTAQPDPYFENVSLLLNGDGTNGAQNNTFLDSSTNNFTITRNGNTTQGSFSPYGNLWSNNFNGSSFITVPNNTDWILNADFTMDGWFYLNSGGANQLVMAQSNTSGQANWYQNINSSNQFVANWISTTTTYSVTSSTLSLNTWTHFAITLSGTTLQLFINGVSQGTTTVSGTANTSSPYTLCMGGLSTTVWPLNGYLSNLRYVKGSVLYSANFTPSTTPSTAVTNTKLLTCQSNRFIDNSSNNATITVNGTPSVSRFSPFNPTAPYSTSVIGGSGYFDGSGDYLAFPDSSVYDFGTGNFTVECWVNPTSVSGDKGLISLGNYNSGQTGILFFLSNGGKIFIGNNGGFIGEGTGSVPVNAWSHLAWVRNSGVLKMYVNGVEKVSSAFTANIAPATFFGIGYDATNNSGFFPGYISNVRINNTAVYTAAFTPPTAPLTAITNTSLLTNFTNAGIPDLAMQNNLETVGNAQVSTSVKKYGTGSLKFNGTTDYLYSPNNYAAYLGTGNWTIEGWIYLNTLSPANYEAIANYGYELANQTYQSWILYINTDNTLHFAYQTGSGNTDTSFGVPSISANTWAHIAIVRNGTTITAYINGTAMATTINIGTNNIIYRAAPSQFTVGWSGTSSFFNGYIDDLRISKVCRYTANFTPPASALPKF